MAGRGVFTASGGSSPFGCADGMALRGILPSRRVELAFVFVGPFFGHLVRPGEAEPLAQYTEIALSQGWNTLCWHRQDNR